VTFSPSPPRRRDPGTTPAPGGNRCFPSLFTDRESIGDLGTGVLTGRRKPPGQERPAADTVLNQSISTLRAAVERAIAHLKDWKLLATRYRGPLHAFPGIVRTITALAFFRTSW
jgi:hypothetical protein